ncbi:hypothetical protein ACFL1H_04005 [Nanoarchaeota archaeon]
MKKIYLILFCILLSLTLIVINGCTNPNQNNTNISEFTDVSSDSVIDADVVVDVDEPINESERDDFEDEFNRLREKLMSELEDDKKSLIDEVDAVKEVIKEDLPTLTVYEGDLVEIALKGKDPDGDALRYDFGIPLNDNGKWQTKKGDAGKYKVQINASDGVVTLTKNLVIIVLNRPPVIEINDVISINEGETLFLNANITDAENDVIDVKINGWINVSEYEVSYNDQGNHKVVILASDQFSQVKKEILIKVLNVNRAPIIQDISNITISEGEKIILNPSIVDPDNDEMTITYRGWLTEPEYISNYEDAGIHKVTITASDGAQTTSKTITVTVNEINRPPEFDIII